MFSVNALLSRFFRLLITWVIEAKCQQHEAENDWNLVFNQEKNEDTDFDQKMIYANWCKRLYWS